MTPPDLVEAPRRGFWTRVSAVWLVPFAALAVALFVAWQSLSSQGPLVEITFDNAAGIAAGETEVRYRDVAVGQVERVDFTEGLERVVVAVRLEADIAPYVDGDASFWIVRPRVTTQGITGIETVLTGVFIQGSWDGSPGEQQATFTGREVPPLGAGRDGLAFTLRSIDGALTSEMPLLFKGVQVGEVGEPRVTSDGLAIEADAVIYAPYDELVTEATRFWDASGFRLELGTAGAEVDFDSLSSLIVGGLAFDTWASGAAPARDGDVFIAFYDEEEARASLFQVEQGEPLLLTAEFAGPEVAALGEGAAVELNGLRIGQVTQVASRIDPADAGVRAQAVLAIEPARLRLEQGGGRAGPDGVQDFLDAEVARGLRARLVTGNILTGGLKIQLVRLAGEPGAIDPSVEPYPALPSAPSEISDVAASAQGVLDRVSALPVEELLDSAIGFLDGASVLVANADTQAIPGDVRALLGDLRGLVGAPELRDLPADLSAALAEVDGAVGDIRALLAEVEEARGVERVLAAVDRAGAALDEVGAATAGVPALVERLAAVAAKAEALDVEGLLAEVSSLSAEARALLAQPSLQALPVRLGTLSAEAEATLAEARSLLAEVDATDVGPRLRAALEAAEDAARSVEASVAGVPDLVARIDALAATANGLPLEELVAEVTGLAGSASALVASPGAQALPGDLSAALGEVEAILREAREGGVVANANATLATARAAAESLPLLVERANGLLDRASATLESFDQSSSVVRDAQDAMREVAAAAGAVAQLARTIERNPNALIFGR